MPADYTAVVPRKRQPEWKTVEDAAAELGVHEATIWRYLKRYPLSRRYQRVGRMKTLVDMHELRELRENPPAEPRPDA